MMALHMFRRLIPSIVPLVVGIGVPAAAAQTAPPVLDVKPAFMLVTTNVTLTTNVVIVTNYVVVTNITRITNYYNAAGQLLTPVTPQASLPPLSPAPAKPAPPDPARIKATQMQALRDMLLQGVASASNILAKPGAFTSNANHQITMPPGVTVFDRKRGEALVQAMNLTAERAIPEVAALLAKSSASITHSNPVEIIRGEQESATRLLIATQGETLATGLTEIVERVGVETKLAEAYANVMLRGGGLLGAVLGTQPQGNVQTHVAQGILRVFAEYMAREEKQIRTNAASRLTPALREAFAP